MRLRNIILVWLVLGTFAQAQITNHLAGVTVPGSTNYPTHKPAPGSAINWSHPLATGLVTALAVNEGSGTNFYDAVWQTNWNPQVLDGTAPGALPPAWLTPPVTPDFPWGGPAINNLGGGSNALQIMGLVTNNLIATNATCFTYGALVQPLDTNTFGRITDSPAAVFVWYLNVPLRGQISTTWSMTNGVANNPTYPFTVNKWILVLFTVQQGLGVMYVNGVPVTNSTNVSVNYIGTNHPVAYNGTIGPGGHGGGQMCNANFASWWIWNNRVLSAGEVAQMYADPWAMFAAGQKGFIKATKVTLTEPAVVSNVCFYSHTATGNVRLALYDDATPKNLVWQSASISNTIAGNWLSTPAPVTLLAGSYWLAWQVDSTLAVPSYTAGNLGDGFVFNQNFSAFPTNLVPSQVTAERWSIYLNYQTPFEAWQTANFGTNATLAAALADPDADGLVNLAEYALNTNPNAANAPPLTAITAGLTFTRNRAATDLNLAVEATSDLTLTNWTTLATKTGPAAWSPNPGVTVTDPGTGLVSVVESATFTSRFWRVRITRP